MPVDPTMVHMAYKEEEEKAKVAIKKLDAILMDAGVMCLILRTDIARLSVNKEFNFHSHFEYARSSVLSQRYCFFSSQEWLYEINIRTSRYR